MHTHGAQALMSCFLVPGINVLDYEAYMYVHDHTGKLLKACCMCIVAGSMHLTSTIKINRTI